MVKLDSNEIGPGPIVLALIVILMVALKVDLLILIVSMVFFLLGYVLRIFDAHREEEEVNSTDD